MSEGRARKAPWIAAALGLLAGGGAMALADGEIAGGAPDRAAIEAVVRDYIMKHPEIIPQAMAELQKRDTTKLIAASRAALETPFPGAVAGAAKPDVTLVMFTDYSCGYCRASAADIDRLIREDKALRVVWRELPILGPLSETAARAGLAAAGQGRYLAFHRAMFAAGVPSEAKIATVARQAGVDSAKAAVDGRSAAVAREIDGNIALARTLGMSGTPTFVIGDRMLAGAVGYDALKTAIAEARARGG